MHCHLRSPDAMPLLTWNVLGAPEHQQPNFDGCIYIHYGAPPYWLTLAPFTSFHLAKFGWAPFSLFAKCWPPCAMPGNEAECRFYGGWVKTLAHFSHLCTNVHKRRGRTPTFTKGEGGPQLFCDTLLARCTVHHLAKFVWVPFVDVHLRSLAMQ